MKLIKKIEFTGHVEALTGLLIGGSSSSMSIGGPDKVVIRNPVSNLPYIPGSSLKGKMRSLLELSYGYVKQVNMGAVKNGPEDNPNLITTQFFGCARKEDQRPSRVLVRDGELLNKKDFLNTDLPYTESKTEVVIDRITSAAMPRTLERVPSGARFGLSIIINIFEGDDERKFIELLFNGLRMIQHDYLGASGSRGSGQVKFVVERVTEYPMEYYHTGQGARDITTSCGLPADLTKGAAAND